MLSLNAKTDINAFFMKNDQNATDAYFLCPNLGSFNRTVRIIVITERIADIMKVALNDAAYASMT
jgi:hypothetical protein